jgi:UDP-glucose 4-epimerase
MKKGVLVTGAAGFIGSRVCEALIAEGLAVFGVDDFSKGLEARVPQGVELISGDVNVLNLESLIVEPVDAIFHLAGQSSGEYSFYHPIEDLQRNYQSTVSMAQFAHSTGVRKFIHASSMSVYGNPPASEAGSLSEDGLTFPVSNYGVSKLAAETFLRAQTHMSSLSLRMFNVYGPGQNLKRLDQGMVSIFLSQALADQSIEVKGSKDRIRDFVFIDDVVEAWLRALSFDFERHLNLNVGTGIGSSVESLVHKIKTLLPGTSITYSDPTPADQRIAVADTDLLSSALKNVPRTSLDDGLAVFLDWAHEECGRTDGAAGATS